MKSARPGSECSFEEVLVSLSSYSDVNDVPRAFVRRVLSIMRANHVSSAEACARMAGAIRTNREVIQAKLSACNGIASNLNILSSRRELLRISRF